MEYWKRIVVVSGCLLTTAYIVFWMVTNSMSYQLRENGFTKKDIIHEEGYSFYDPSDHITKVMLLANDKKLALVEMRKQPVWGWDTITVSVIDQPNNGQYVLAGNANIKISWATFYTEFHDFVARYVDAIDSNINNTVVPPLIKGSEQMYLNVDYFSVNGRTLLFAHAISGKPNHSFGSEEVTEYINSRLKELGIEK